MYGVRWYIDHPTNITFLKVSEFSPVVYVQQVGDSALKNMPVNPYISLLEEIRYRITKLSKNFTKCFYDFGTYFKFNFFISFLFYFPPSRFLWTSDPQSFFEKLEVDVGPRVKSYGGSTFLICFLKRFFGLFCPNLALDNVPMCKVMTCSVNL